MYIKHSKMKSWLSSFHLSLVAVESSLFSLQIEELLSFQAPDEFINSCNGSWKDIPAGSTPASTVGSIQRLVAPILNVG